ncbi:histidine phosphatase family protein [Sedimentitalea sp. XS_ASV28]|uniref:histidine phosphatase family protein n=1 Tax=Sedimentitalea sp. XS_ASV28 TaxID=3241296 RepID=UPI003515C2C8
MSFPEFLILRHGETEWNREGRMQGGLDSALTEVGRDQARRQNEILQAFGVSGWSWFASPQGRAMSTARIAAEGLSSDIVPDTRLREIGVGEWTGLLRSEIAQRAPYLFETGDLDWYDHAPGGEGLIALERRARAFLRDLDGPAVIVTHGITSRVIRCVAQGLPAEAFDTLGGGQGVVYHIRDGESRLLS